MCREKLKPISLFPAFTKRMEVTKDLSKDVKEAMEKSKVKGVPYLEYVTEDPGNKGSKLAAWPPPQSPPYTSWSGLMMCPPDNTYAKRFKEKCGGVAVNSDGTIYAEEKWQGATAIVGYWTAPEDWSEMTAGREAPTPCSTKDYPKQGFQPSWA